MNAVAYVPRVLALEAVDGGASRAEDFERLDFIEHVVAKRLPIHVAALQRPRHERVEVC